MPISQDTEFDYILITYKDGQYQAALQKAERIVLATGERVVTYPAGYVPILVPRYR